MALTPSEREALAAKVAGAVPAIREFIAVDKEDKIHIVKHLLDKQVGTDETAIIASIPGLTPELTEMITDPLLDVLAAAVVKWLVGEPEVA